VRWGHAVSTDAGESFEGVLAELVEQPFDLLVVDLGLPGFEGSALIDALAFAGVRPASIVCTGFSEERLAPVRGKVDAVLRKPFTIEQLASAMAGLFSANRTARPASLVADVVDAELVRSSRRA
jgi:DNA-binding response OmpR family regulator